MLRQQSGSILALNHRGTPLPKYILSSTKGRWTHRLLCKRLAVNYLASIATKADGNRSVQFLCGLMPVPRLRAVAVGVVALGAVVVGMTGFHCQAAFELSLDLLEQFDHTFAR